MTGKKPNALKHGANTKEVMLWNERYEDYEALRAELYLEFSPSGAPRNIWSELFWICVGASGASNAMSSSRCRSGWMKFARKERVKRFIQKLCSFADEFEEANKREIVETLFDHLEPEYSYFVQMKWPLETGEDESKWGSASADSEPQVLAVEETISRR
jgi:hypothetical protein